MKNLSLNHPVVTLALPIYRRSHAAGVVRIFAVVFSFFRYSYLVEYWRERHVQRPQLLLRARQHNRGSELVLIVWKRRMEFHKCAIFTEILSSPKSAFTDTRHAKNFFVLFDCSSISRKPAKSFCIYLHYNFSRVTRCRVSRIGTRAFTLTTALYILSN